MVFIMAKAKLFVELFLIFGFVLIITGTGLLIIGSMKNNNNLLLIAFIPLGLGILMYISLIIVFLIALKRNKKE